MTPVGIGSINSWWLKPRILSFMTAFSKYDNVLNILSGWFWHPINQIYFHIQVFIKTEFHIWNFLYAYNLKQCFLSRFRIKMRIYFECTVFLDKCFCNPMETLKFFSQTSCFSLKKFINKSTKYLLKVLNETLIFFCSLSVNYTFSNPIFVIPFMAYSMV